MTQELAALIVWFSIKLALMLAALKLFGEINLAWWAIVAIPSGWALAIFFVVVLAARYAGQGNERRVG